MAALLAVEGRLGPDGLTGTQDSSGIGLLLLSRFKFQLDLNQASTGRQAYGHPRSWAAQRTRTEFHGVNSARDRLWPSQFRDLSLEGHIAQTEPYGGPGKHDQYRRRSQAGPMRNSAAPFRQHAFKPTGKRQLPALVLGTQQIAIYLRALRPRKCASYVGVEQICFRHLQLSIQFRIAKPAFGECIALRLGHLVQQVCDQVTSIYHDRKSPPITLKDNAFEDLFPNAQRAVPESVHGKTEMASERRAILGVISFNQIPAVLR